MVEEVIKLRVDSTQAKQGIKEVNKELGQTESSLEGVTSQADKFTGGAISRMKGLAGSLKSVAMGFRTVGVAIAASGIGLLIVAVGALTAAFNSSEEGQNKMAKIMGVIGALTGNLVDLMADLGEKIIWAFENPQKAWEQFKTAIIDNLKNRVVGLIELFPKLGEAISLTFQGKFKEAGQVAVNAVAKVGLGVEDFTDKMGDAINAVGEFIEENKKEAAQAARVADMRAKAEKIERQLLIDRSKIEGTIAELRLKARQEDEFSAQERKDALIAAKALEEGLLDTQQKALELKRDAQILENTFSRTNKEGLKAEAEGIAEVNRLTSQRADTARTYQRELNTINTQITAKEKEELTKRAEYEKELRDALAIDEEEKRQLEIVKTQEKYDTLIAQAVKYGEDTLALEDANQRAIDALKDKYRQEKEKKEEEENQKTIALKKSEVDAKQAANYMIFQSSMAALGAIADLVGRETKMGKALALASIAANTAIGFVQGLRIAQQGATATGPAAPYTFPVFLATQFAAVLGAASQAKSILQGGGSGGFSAGSFGGAGSFAPPSSITIPGQSGINSIVNGFGQNNAPIQAYVISGQVSSAQELERKRLANATFG